MRESMSVLMLVMVFLFGCTVQSTFQKQDNKSKFDEVYHQLGNTFQAEVNPGSTDPLVTLSVSGLPLSDFARLLSSKYDISILYEAELDSKPVSMELVSVPVSDLFTMLSRRLSVQTSRVGNSWFIGHLKTEDRGVFCRRVRRLDADGLQRAINVGLSEVGKVTTFPDGMVIIADRTEVLKQIGQTLEAIERAPIDTWCVQLYYVANNEKKGQSYGADTTALLQMSYGFAKASALSAITATSTLNSAFSAALKASATHQKGFMVSKPLFVLSDGETASVTSGSVIPVAKKSVSDQGTVQTQSYENVSVGLNSTVTIRQMTTGSAKLTLLLSDGQISGYVNNEVPIQQKNEFKTVAVVASGGTYLLGSLDKSLSTDSASGMFKKFFTSFGRDKEWSRLEIWCRVFRVGQLVDQK